MYEGRLGGGLRGGVGVGRVWGWGNFWVGGGVVGRVKKIKKIGGLADFVEFYG